MRQLLWFTGRAAALIFESYPEIATRTTGTLSCEDDGMLHYLPEPRSEIAGHDDIGIYGFWAEEILGDDLFADVAMDDIGEQCSDHPYCLQPAGHEEDPELLAIVDEAIQSRHAYYEEEFGQ